MKITVEDIRKTIREIVNSNGANLSEIIEILNSAKVDEDDEDQISEDVEEDTKHDIGGRDIDVLDFFESVRMTSRKKKKKGWG